MSVRTSYDAAITINSGSYTDCLNKITINDGQETRELRIMGNAHTVARAGLSTPSMEATFYANHTSTGISQALTNLIGIVASSSGFDVVVRYSAGLNLGTSNPVYTMTSILDGDLNVMDDEHGEVAQITARFLPYSSFSISTTTS